MSSLSSIAPGTETLVENARSEQVLNTQEFMQLLITELTNQDPFEPMKNQELLNQIATIQELEANQNMSSSFNNVVDQLTGLVNQFGTMINREQLGSAGAMVGQLVAGTSAEGDSVFGKVISVSVVDGEIKLDLDSGHSLTMDQLTALGGTIDSVTASDMIGEVVIGESEGRQVIGTVESVEVNGSDVTLHIRESGSSSEAVTAVPLSSATVISEATADLMIGLNVKGNNGQDVSGVVQGYRIDEEGIKLLLSVSESLEQIVLPLSSVTEINPSDG